MRKFQFQLERVRRWRQEQAALEELKLERAHGQLAALAEQKAGAERSRAESERQVLQQASIDAGELQALDAYRRHVRARIGWIETRRREVGVEVERQRQRVVEARRQAELLERLKAKMFAQWRVAGDREEEALATELYLAKRIRPD